MDQLENVLFVVLAADTDLFNGAFVYFETISS